MTNDKKIKHSQFLLLCHQNSNRNQGKKEFLNSHDGQKSYLLTCTGHSAHVGWRAGTGQQVTFLAIVGIQKFFFPLIPITILKAWEKELGMFNFFAICNLNSHTVIRALPYNIFFKISFMRIRQKLSFFSLLPNFYSIILKFVQ